jgi:hypothetical protein
MSGNALKLLDLLFQRPLINVGLAEKMLGVSFVTANTLVARFEELELLEEITGNRRSRVFRYTPYLELFDEPTGDAEDTPVQSTEAADAD